MMNGVSLMGTCSRNAAQKNSSLNNVALHADYFYADFFPCVMLILMCIWRIQNLFQVSIQLN